MICYEVLVLIVLRTSIPSFHFRNDLSNRIKKILRDKYFKYFNCKKSYSRSRIARSRLCISRKMMTKSIFWLTVSMKCHHCQQEYTSNCFWIYHRNLSTYLNISAKFEPQKVYVPWEIVADCIECRSLEISKHLINRNK